MAECLLCTEPLTMKNVINTNCCTMPCCKDCFFRWTKVKNTCPCCRANIFCNSEENKEIMHLKELLAHRGRIVHQVEEAYDDLERIKHDCVKQLGRREKIIEQINDFKEDMDDLVIANKGSYRLIKHLKLKIKNGLIHSKTKTKHHHNQLMHHLKTSLVRFVNANRKNPKRFKNFKYFSIAVKNFIKQERMRKKRVIFKQKLKRSSNDFSTCLKEVFGDAVLWFEDDAEYADMPSLEVDHYYNIQNFMRNNSRSENLQRDFMNYFASNISWR